MKVVILAAGKSTRTYPLTKNRPKPLLKILNLSMLQHNLTQLSGLVDEAIIITGFMKEKIEEHLGSEYNGIKIRYVEQKEQLGTGHAILCAEPYLDNEARFLVIVADDLYSSRDLAEVIKLPLGSGVYPTNEPYRFGIFSEKGGIATGLIEKPEGLSHGLANTSTYLLCHEIMEILKNTPKSMRGEIEITSGINELLHNKEYKLYPLKDYWLPITYPWNLLDANTLLLNRIKESTNKGDIEDSVTTRDTVVIGQNSVVRRGSKLHGPVYIGKNCEICEGTIIGPNTVIEDDVTLSGTVKDSVIMSGTVIEKAEILHSIIGINNVIKSGVKTVGTEQYENHLITIKDQKIDTMRKELGAITAENVTILEDVSIKAGVMIWPGKTVDAGIVVSKHLI